MCHYLYHLDVNLSSLKSVAQTIYDVVHNNILDTYINFDIYFMW